MLALACALAVATPPLTAQAATPVTAAPGKVPPVAAQPVSAQANPDSVAAMLPFARAFASVTALREQADAEYAEPRNKKPEVLAELRAKYRVERERLLKAQGFTDARYEEYVLRVSGVDAARVAFETALGRITGK